MFGLLVLCYFASIVGTITGFGTATIMVPIMMFSYSFHEALFFVGIIHWFNGFWRVVSFREGFDLRLILTFGLSGILASILGAKCSFMIDQSMLTKIIAGFLLAYAVFLLVNPNFKMKYSDFNSVLAGLSSGFVAGISSMGGAIRAAFLASFDLPKSVFLANSALLLVLIDTARVVTYFAEGMRIEDLTCLRFFNLNEYIVLAICIVVSMLGVSTGKLIVDKVSQDKFRIAVAIFLIVVAIRLIFS